METLMNIFSTIQQRSALKRLFTSFVNKLNTQLISFVQCGSVKTCRYQLKVQFIATYKYCYNTGLQKCLRLYDNTINKHIVRLYDKTRHLCKKYFFISSTLLVLDFHQLQQLNLALLCTQEIYCTPLALSKSFPSRLHMKGL